MVPALGAFTSVVVVSRGFEYRFGTVLVTLPRAVLKWLCQVRSQFPLEGMAAPLSVIMLEMDGYSVLWE